MQICPAAFGRLCVETDILNLLLIGGFPAAFGRLCVETLAVEPPLQPLPPAAFGRLCVETQNQRLDGTASIQPPSGGCVLKPVIDHRNKAIQNPAAFGRLCVETLRSCGLFWFTAPAAFGRLCVET